jgi:hypothetical protein
LVSSDAALSTKDFLVQNFLLRPSALSYLGANIQPFLIQTTFGAKNAKKKIDRF